MPTLPQIQSFVKRYREKTSVITDYDMKEYCAATSTPPENIHKAFVIGSRIEGARRFIVCWSTPYLLALQLKSELLEVKFSGKKLQVKNSFLIILQ
jgi:hypothetical protein